MAYMVRGYIDICFVGDGMGPAGVSTAAIANVPGYGSTQTGGAMAMQQTMRFQQAEVVGGTLDSPVLTDLKTAISTLATDLGNQISAAQLATIQGWSSGSP